MSNSSDTTGGDKLGDSPVVDLTGKIMVAIIIILFIVVVSFVLFHLYDKVFWWRRNSQSRRGSVVASGQNGALRSGLDPSVLRSLPVSVFQSQDLKDGLECSVCLSEVVEGEKVRLLPKCNHGFHVDCIDMWFQSHATCPLCRSPVASSDSDEPNVASSAPDNSESQTLSFPTNVLIWGNRTQISSTAAAAAASLEESTTSHSPSSSSSSGGSCSNSNTTTATATNNNNNRHHGMLVIDIPSGSEAEDTSSSSASRFAEDELKSPVIRRLRSLRRLLSNNRLNPWSPTSTDVEQAKGGGGQS